MIATDFATNESWDDALLSLQILLQPWKWRTGKELEITKQLLFSRFHIANLKYKISLFLSGRSALYFLLKSLNLPKNSEIIVQAFTCEAVVLPITELGFKPKYIDIEPDTYSMDYRFLSNSLSANPNNRTTGKEQNRVTVLILQHTFGLTPKFRKEILKLAEVNELIVIEDLAHGFNPEIFQKNYESDQKSHYYLLSFGRSKMLSSVFGGAVISADDRLVNKSAELEFPPYWFIFRCLLYKPLTMLIKSVYDLYLGKIMHKIANKLNLLIPEITKKEKEGNYDKLFNFAYPNALAMLLSNQLNKLERINQQRAIINNTYNSAFSGKRSKITLNNRSIIRYPLSIENREKLAAKMREKNIFLGKWYDRPVAPKELDPNRVGYKSGSCPVAEKICKGIINLPTNISQHEAETIINELKKKD